MEENKTEIENKIRHHSTEKISYAEKGRFYKIRQILNILFIVLAIAGMISYYLVGEMVGGILLVTAVFIKISECVLRIIP